MKRVIEREFRRLDRAIDDAFEINAPPRWAEVRFAASTHDEMILTIVPVAESLLAIETFWWEVPS